MSARDSHLTADDFDRQLTRLAVATADQSDPEIDSSVNEVLRLVRDHLQMDVAFVSHLHGGRRSFDYVQPDDGKQVIAAGGSDPVETGFCQRVIDGRQPQLVRDVRKLPDFSDLPPTPFPIGAHLSTPIVLASGAVYGTLCCFSFAPTEALAERDLKRLQMAARMVAGQIDKARQRRGLGDDD